MSSEEEEVAATGPVRRLSCSPCFDALWFCYCKPLFLYLFNFTRNFLFRVSTFTAITELLFSLRLTVGSTSALDGLVLKVILSNTLSSLEKV